MFENTKPTRSRTPRRVFALAAAAAIVLAACGDDDDTAPAAAATTEAAAPATAAPVTTAGGKGDYDYGGGSTATTAAPATGGAAVMVADSDLGKIVTGSNGMTVYLFMPDKQGAPTCTDACAKSWPAVMVADAASLAGGDGIDASLLKTVDNPAGGTQVTYNGWPLYYFAGDSAPGDTNGQGQGGIWYAIDPTGNAIDND